MGGRDSEDKNLARLGEIWRFGFMIYRMTRHHLAPVAFAVLAFATNALAYVVLPLPGATPQQAAVNQVFANPIGVVVTDETGHPIADATVAWNIPISRSLRMESRPARCFYDLGVDLCSTVTDANGVGRLPGVYMTSAGSQEISIAVAINGRSEGLVYIQLSAEPQFIPARIGAISGANQRAVIGTKLPDAFGIRLVRADGSPLANQPVRFNPSSETSQPLGHFPDATDDSRSQWLATTDADGYAYSAPFTVGWGVGRGTVIATYFDSNASLVVRVPFDYFVTNVQGGTSFSFHDMWWSGPPENGWGMSIAQHGDKLFSIVFAYDDAGKPTWYSMSDGYWYGGVGNEFIGGMVTPKGAPFFAYDASRLSLYETGKFGGARLRFQGEGRGRLLMDFVTRKADKAIERYDFSKDIPSPISGVGDLWWGGPSQSGWGVSIIEQKGALFSIWLTYDDDGNATWFAMTDGQWTSPNTYEGRMHRTAGSPLLGAAYDASKFRATDVGPYKLRFVGPNSAQLEYNVEGRTGTLSLSRTPFGDD